MSEPSRGRMETATPTEDVDLVLRHVERQFPRQIVQALLPPGAEVSAASWLDTQVTSRQRRRGRVLHVTVDGSGGTSTRNGR